MDARIIKLSPESSISRVATFEEAFGEFSEAGGRGRARRQRRRMERIENRAERRSARKTHRQENREQRLQARLQRRGEKAEARAERKKLRHPEEEPTNQNQPQEQGGGNGTEQAPPSNEGQGGGNAIPPASEPQEQGGGQGGSYGDESQSGGYQDEQGGGESDSQGDETDEQGNDSEGGEDYGFDGVISAEDRFGDVAGDDNIERIVVNPAVQDMANKYEWNKELACRLIMKRNDAHNSGMATSGLTDQIEERKKRMAEIKANFDSYLNFDADFSECCGCSGADGSGNFKKANPKLKRKRSMEVKKALETSRNNRMSVKGGSAMDKMRKADKIRHYGGDVIPVEEGLNPEFSQNQIVVPSEIKSNLDGNSMLPYSVGYLNDAGAPPIREVFLNADGEGKGAFIGVGSLLLGVGVTIGILYLVDKYKVIK
jgi:hypothetical protein